MKVRMQGNSIRYRLREPEVINFKKHGIITETVQFGNKEVDRLLFSLQKSSISEVGVQHAGETITIHVPQSLASKWTDTELVGFDAIIEIGKGKELKILVEKDFECLDAAEEDNEGAYPNPAKQC